MFAIVLIPVAHRHARAQPQPAASPRRMDRPVRIGSAVDPGDPGARILLDQRENVGDYLADVGLVAALFCAISLVVGYVVPKAFGVVEAQAIASSMEIGVHNATLAIFVAVEVLDRPRSRSRRRSTRSSCSSSPRSGACCSPAERRRDREDRSSRPTQAEVSAAPPTARSRAAPGPGGRSRSLSAAGQLGGREAGSVVLVGDEQHVVAEPAAPPQLADDPARHLARARRARVPSGWHERDGAARSARRGARRVRRRAGRAAARCCAGRRLAAGPAQRADSTPGHAVERVDAQAAVVGQRRQPGGRDARRAP